MLAKLSDRWYILGAVVTSALLQLGFINKASIWHDEAYTMWLVSYDMPEILTRTARDVHPPLYYLLLDIWTGIFGHSAVAARSLSLVAILGIITVSFFLVKRLFGLKAARISVFIMTLAPFLIRYGIEARMYALVAFWLTAATYLLIKALAEQKSRLLYLYAILMALAFYTHYYAVFMVLVHWVYVAWYSWPRSQSRRLDLFNRHWWFANGAIGLLFLPWLPVAYSQFSRVQASFWIPPVDSATIPGTLGSWLHYTSLSQLPLWLRLTLTLLVVGLLGWAIAKNKLQRRSLGLIGLWAFTGPVLVWLISALGRPVYVDRYFVFSAVGFYMLLAGLWYVKPLNQLARLRPYALAGLVILMIFGLGNVSRQSDHRMAEVGRIVSQQAQPADAVIAAELYVYLDFSYYNQSPVRAKLYAPGGVSGYGETSLFYDQPELLTTSWDELRPSSRTVWVVGKVGEKDYWQAIPNSWRLVSQHRAKDALLQQFRQP